MRRIKLKNKPSKQIKERITDYLELPKEIMLDLPQLIFKGDREVYIENCRGVAEYSNELVRVNANNLTVNIIGSNLNIKNIADTQITVYGKIKALEFKQ